MRLLCILCLFLIIGGAVSAQTVINGPGTSRTFLAPYAGPQIIVRDSKANLYVIYRYAATSIQWDVAIARSTNGGASWNKTWQTGFASLVSTDFGNYGPCMAIDSQDNLHCAWFHRNSGSYAGSRYNRFDAAKNVWGTEWTVSSYVRETNAPCIAVDGNDYVWFSHGKSGWDSYLERSNLPFASDGKFTMYKGPLTSSYSQKVSIVADALNRIHVSYYDTASGAGIKHQWVDPGATTPKWTLTNLSTHSGDSARADYWSKMAGDNAGNVYIIYTLDDQAGTSSRTKDTEFYVRKWDGSTQKWGNPVLVHGVPVAVWHPGYKTSVKDYNDGRIISCACDETTGELYFTYRDFVSGDFVLGRWRGDDTESHTIYAKLMNTAPLPVTNRNYFFLPHFRGSLWPKTNRTSWGLDLMYVTGDQTTAKVYTDYYEHFPLGSMSSTALPKIGTTYPLDLGGVAEGGKTYVAAVTMSGLMSMVQVGRRYIPLVADSLFYLAVLNVLPSTFVNFQGVLNATGAGQAKVVIPNIPALVGVKVDSCFVTFDGGGLRAISNPWGFAITN